MVGMVRLSIRMTCKVLASHRVLGDYALANSSAIATALPLQLVLKVSCYNYIVLN